MQTLSRTGYEYVVTHTRTIRLGITRDQVREDRFDDEERALECIRSLQALAISNAKSEGRDLISHIEMRSRQIWASEWDYSRFGQ